MRRNLMILGILLLLGVGAFLFFYSGKNTIIPRIASSTGFRDDTSPYDLSLLAKKYENKPYKFSVMTPEGFTAQEIPNDAGEGITVVLQNNDGAGVQIQISPSSEEINTLTAEDIRASLPDMKITEEQEVEIGNDYRGVAFKSDNEAFGGDSRDVWFIFRGTLYQITTYGKDDALLQAMFTTWKFF